LEKTWKELVMTSFKVVSLFLPEGTEETMRNSTWDSWSHG
jgi:hypothetical protein